MKSQVWKMVFLMIAWTVLEQRTPVFAQNEEKLWDETHTTSGSGVTPFFTVDVAVNDFAVVAGVGKRGTFPNDHRDIVLVGYNRLGVRAWTVIVDGPAQDDDEPFDVEIDGAGNIYVTGYVSKLISNVTRHALWMAKYASNGTLLWEVSESTISEGHALVVDANGNVYAAGFAGSGTTRDVLVVKRNTNGGRLWSRTYNGDPQGNGPDEAKDIVLDNTGSNVYVTGCGTTRGDQDYWTLKLNASNGALVWDRFHGGRTNEDCAFACAMDENDNVIVTGRANKLTQVGQSPLNIRSGTTVKYSSNGNELWVHDFIPFDPPRESDDCFFTKVALNHVGTGVNIYVGGFRFLGFDASEQAVVVKLDDVNNAVTQAWSRPFGNGLAINRVAGLACPADGADDVFVAFTVIASDLFPIMETHRLQGSNGASFWTFQERFNHESSFASAVALDGCDSLYVAGNSQPDASDGSTRRFSLVKYGRHPEAVNDTYTVAEDGTLNVSAANGVQANDNGNCRPGYFITNERTLPQHGTLALSSDGSFTYTPDPNFTGTDSFTYRYILVPRLTTATVTINVTPVNDPPVANNDNFSVNEDTTLNIAAPGVLANDTDVEGSTLTAVLVSNPSRGTLTLNANGSFTYIPAANFNGTDSFTYRARDAQGALSNVATVTITVTPVNDPPVANNDNFSVNEDTTLNIAAPGVLANDTDVDGDALTAVLVSNPSRGTLTLNANGSFTYIPAANFNGADSFTYRARDAQGALSNVATVNITVNPVNDPPVANNDNFSVNEDTTLNIAAPGVLANDTDVDGDALTAVIRATPEHGAVSLAADGSFRYRPNANYNGPDQFTYQARDAQGALSNVATVNITVNPVNDPPVANNDNFSVNANSQLNVSAPGVLANDTDVEGASLQAVLVANPTNGILTLNTDGSFTYTPNTNFTGTDSFTYRAREGGAGLLSNVATVTIVVRSDVPGDVDGNGCVNDLDLGRVLLAFGQTGSGLPEDLNRNGIVDNADLEIVLSNVGGRC